MTDLTSILDERAIIYKRTNNPTELLIQCTSGRHEDTNPSLAYNLERNIFRCFSCGFQGGAIKFLESIGITQRLNIESKQEYKIAKLKRKLRTLQNTDNIKMPFNMSRVVWDFNGIGKETLAEFGAFTTTEYDLEDYICVPVFQFKRLKFIDGRLSFSNSEKPKYTRKPKGVQIKDVVFPLDKISNMSDIVLVEGMSDMMNLWQHGVTNVLCIFGALNFGKDKVKLLEKVGVVKVTLMLDGDKAGQMAAPKIKDMLEQDNVMTNIIKLKEHEDPGNLSIDQIQFYLKGT